MADKVNLFWFRRDLRLEDNHGLYCALKAGLPVVPVFIFDSVILDELEDKDDRRVNFIRAVLVEMQASLEKHGSTLDVRYGKPEAIFKELTSEYDIDTVFTNHDYEPYARQRDEQIGKYLKGKKIGFQTFKDQVIFEKNEIMKPDGEKYMIFTPYSKKWRAALTATDHQSYKTGALMKHCFRHAPKRIPSLAHMGFKANDDYPAVQAPDKDIIKHYDKTRDIPGIQGTTHMGVHLRFGTISIRKLVTMAKELNAVYLGELIWREFFMQHLWHQPRLMGHSCKPAYDHIKWRYNEKEFDKWCQGMTGYPIVDAGMRELNTTGFMHNRVRMITASFLVKHLLIDWRWGEAYFARQLLDFELSSNNGNWQWVAGCGCDAAPYFRVFNPATQTKKFDKDLKYIRKWVPEFEDFSAYPQPMVEHEFARARCLKAYKEALKGTQ